jgi:hypothetical protein
MQLVALRIGEASYLASSVSSQLFEEMSVLDGWLGKGGHREVMAKRFKIVIDDDMTGEDFVAEVGLLYKLNLVAQGGYACIYVVSTQCIYSVYASTQLTA